jgi:uncharacterized repeat protein (TIGR02543 family)
MYLPLGGKKMRVEFIKKIVVSFIVFVFISTAVVPAIHSQFTAGFFSQQTSLTGNNDRIRVPPYLVQQPDISSGGSPHSPPAPLDGTPPTIHLPSSQVTMKVFTNSSISYFRTQLLNVPAGYEVTNRFYTGWCSDYAHYIYTNTPYQTNLYSSYNTSLPSRDYHQNWSKVNYILNHKQGTNWHQVQWAILYMLDFGNLGLNATGWAMVNAAAQYGGSYVPHCGDIIVIIADPGANVQRQIFELTVPSYTLSITTDGSGSVSKNPDQTAYSYSQIVTLTATPTTGWSFSYWSGNASGSNPVTTVTMNGNRAVTAHFTQNEYTLSTSVVGSGSVGKNPSQATYHYGDVVQVTATANPGWTFNSWSGNLSGSLNPASITVTGNMGVTATFTQNEYTLSTSVIGSGSVGKNPSQATYHYGDVVQLTANANPGWTFSSWSGDLSGSTNPGSVTITGNMGVTATFTQDEYILSVNVVGFGSVGKAPDQATYHYGDVVQLTANANPGWTFSSWSGDFIGSTNPASLTIMGNTDVTATFTQDEYTLSVNIIGSGSVGKTPDLVTYHYGDVVQLSASPSIGWYFDHWSGDLTGSTNPGSVTITGNMGVTATFTQDEYTLTISVDGSGSVDASPDQATYHYGDVVQLSASPEIGWSFGSWSGDLTGSTNPGSITITGNMGVTATFTQNEYTLSTSVVGSGSVAKNPNQATYHYGDVVQLTASPDIGWSFSYWGGDLSGSTNPTSITITGNMAVIAYFTQNEYTLAITIDPVAGGSVAAVPAPPYYYGDVVTLTATANPGYSFDHWGGDSSGSNAVTTVTMTSNKAVTAYFTESQYSLTITVDPVAGGSVAAVPAPPYYYGDMVTLTATPNPGYTFDHWSGDASGSNPITTVTMDGNKAVTAHFTHNQYTVSITIDPTGSGTVTTTPSGPYYYGDVVTLTATANPGYTFDHWSGDASGSNPVTTVTMDGNKTITAHFTQNVYLLTIIVNPQVGGSVTADPAPPYHYNDIVKLTAVANTGYVFDHWSGDATGSSPVVNVTIDGNKTVTANFILSGDVQPPLVAFAKPLNGVYLFDEFILPSKKPIIIQGITIQVNASDNQSGVKKVEFFIDDVLVGNDSTAPYTYDWKDLRTGTRRIKAIAYDNAGNSATVEISVMKWRFHPVLALLLYYIVRPLLQNLRNWIHDHMPGQVTTG